MAPRPIIVILLFVGCGATSGSSSHGRPLECGAVISDLFARSKAFATQIWAGQQVDMSKQLAELIETVTPVVVQSCRDDHWSMELLGCMDEMTVTDDPHKCNHLMTGDQAVAMARRLMPVMTQQVFKARDGAPAVQPR